jgi:hypothetical protein
MVQKIELWFEAQEGKKKMTGRLVRGRIHLRSDLRIVRDVAFGKPIERHQPAEIFLLVGIHKSVNFDGCSGPVVQGGVTIAGHGTRWRHGSYVRTYLPRTATLLGLPIPSVALAARTGHC